MNHIGSNKQWINYNIHIICYQTSGLTFLYYPSTWNFNILLYTKIENFSMATMQVKILGKIITLIFNTHVSGSPVYDKLTFYTMDSILTQAQQDLHMTNQLKPNNP